MTYENMTHRITCIKINSVILYLNVALRKRVQNANEIKISGSHSNASNTMKQNGGTAARKASQSPVMCYLNNANAVKFNIL